MTMNVFARLLLAAPALTLLAPASSGLTPVGPNNDATARGGLRLRPFEVGPIELTVWRSDAFRRQFAESFQPVTEVEPSLTNDEIKAMKEVLALLGEEQLEKAVGILEKEQNEAASAVFDFTLAGLQMQEDQFESAEANFQKAVAKFPKFRRAWRNLAILYMREGEPAKALPALRRVVSLGGGDSTIYGLLGYACSSADDELAAESAYRMANLLDPETLDWKMGLARSFFKQARYAEAASLCGSLIETNPKSSDLWLLQANAFLGLKEPLRAAENYELVDRLGKSTPDSLKMLADIYVNEELYDLAVDTYARALPLDPTGTITRAVRAAKLMTARGATDTTQRLITTVEPFLADTAGGAASGEQAGVSEAGAILDPEAQALRAEQRKDLLKLRARIAMTEGAGEEEARILEEIVSLDPLDGEALILLGKHARRGGDDEKAIFYFERAAGIEAFEADAKVEHAQVLARQKRFAEALPLLRRAQELKPRASVGEYLAEIEKRAKGKR